MTRIFNAIDDNGRRTSFKVQDFGSRFIISQDGCQIITADDEQSAQNAVECMMKDNGWHLEELVGIDDSNDFSTAITFDRVDPETVIIKVYEWMGGRYVQLGPEDRYSVELATAEYGYR
jgi:hypothetical protein